MKFLFNTEDLKDLINSAIDTHGYAPEHNYEYFMSYESKESKTCYVDFGDHKGLMSIRYKNNKWQLLSEIIAPKNEQADLFIMFVNELINREELKKMLVEIPPDIRKEIISKTKNSRIIIGKPVEHYYVPIIDLKIWDTELNGSDMSKLRKAKNRFFRNFRVEIIKDVKSINFEDYKQLVIDWKNFRKAKDRAVYEDYLTFFKENFKGSDFSLAIKLNEKLCGVASAWLVPNKGKTVYYGINLHNYSVPELGDFLTTIFLDELKKEGFEFLDFGASDKKLLAYKNKFKPIKTYDIICFYTRVKKE